MTRLVAVAWGLVLLAGLARADVIWTVHGGRIEGEIVEETPRRLKIRDRRGMVHTLRRADVERIERRRPLDVFEERLETLEAGDVEGFLALATYAREHDMPGAARHCYRQVLEVEPDHDVARAELGYRRVDGRWLRGDALREALGLVEHQGRWVTPEERDMLLLGLERDGEGRWGLPAEERAPPRRSERRPRRADEPDEPEPRPRRSRRDAAPGPSPLRGAQRLRITYGEQTAWLQGVIDYPRTKEALREALARFAEGPDGETEAEAAVRTLNAYRELVGLPSDVVLNARYVELATAAARVCEALGRLTHEPTTNPGLPDALWRRGKEGCGSSNLHGVRALVPSVHSYMDDSDPSNIGRVGHRRWCLSPSMDEVGFGQGESGYSAMYVFDRGASFGGDAICYPARGYMPLDLMGGDHVAWSVSPNPGRYRIANPGAVQVLVVPMEADAAPLEVDAQSVDASGMGRWPCLIFRPQGLVKEPGRRYWVRIVGFTTPAGQPAPFDYAVEWIR